jgi:hypothetical protein
MPLLKRTTHRALPAMVRFAGEALEGISKPAGDAVLQLGELRKLEDEAREIL